MNESGRLQGVTRQLSLIVVDENQDTNAGIRPPILREDASTNLQQQVRSALRPLHLLLLGHALTYHLVDCRFHEASADSFTVMVTLA